MPNITTFLYVEDDRDSAFFAAQLFKTELRHLGFHTVGDGADAVDYLSLHGAFANRQDYPCADIILLDLKMPRMDGFDFLQWIRSPGSAQARLTPVVVFTSSNHEVDVHRAYELGANAYMVKASRLEDFQEQIKMLGRYWSDFVTRPAA